MQVGVKIRKKLGRFPYNLIHYFITHAAISYYFTPQVYKKRVETCMSTLSKE